MAGPVPANHADPMVRRSIPWPAHAFSSRSAGPAGVDGRHKAGQDGFQKPAWPLLEVREPDFEALGSSKMAL